MSNVRYRNLRDAVRDLERHGMLLRIREEVDPDLEMAEIHRQVFERRGPAILFERVKGSPFQAVSNIYGTFKQTEFLFRHTLDRVKRVIELKKDPTQLLKKPGRYLGAPFTALSALPSRNWFGAPATFGTTTIDRLPQIKSWQMDGGAFITMPQVYTEDPDAPGNVMQSNLGMYRIQLSGNEYIPNEEIGLHYQLHRGIGVHHTKYNRSDKPFLCSIFVGGPPSHAFSAIMPLPEGLSELTFAGMLAGRRFRYTRRDGHFISADADFVITGEILKDVKKPEGPFGDHLGYYSLAHDFPVMRVHKVYHRKDPLWHFSVVGRPPMEDSSFGWLIHELVAPLTPQEFPGLKELHAVDAAGVHPLLLAIGHERYMPFRERKPEEILTIANRILGSGQTSLAKFLIIAASDDNPNLDTHDIPHFFRHVLERVDWTRDLHFQTRTTIDTLDYSGTGWNEGSKVVVACRGDQRRELKTELPQAFSLPEGFSAPHFCLPGILAVQAPKFEVEKTARDQAETLCRWLERFDLQHIPLILLVDDSPFAAATLNNFLWVAFTRANPSHDVYGVQAFTEFKHWGCRGPLVVDARKKPHHAPELEVDPDVQKKAAAVLEQNGF
ncbi:MAG: UbiD family decarboxylase [Haliscomenobacteraceae bacterium CHB4]|nr:4-hydroxybenzoate decarboxylase subunit C [Saprospiraceae bacterium]MCE7922067.1 UbiD family decarboxylase [Haliscomenobacteraceae bacterium CHB4]